VHVYAYDQKKNEKKPHDPYGTHDQHESGQIFGQPFYGNYC
jgi:hypothetical protein